jgi:jumonji domain-containing protein 2
VLRKAERGYDESDDDETETRKNAHDLTNKPPIHYLRGMAKITLPKGFCDQLGIAKDESGRGPDWDAGTPLGDMVLPSPINQCVRGIGGIYEYTFLDLPPISVAEFRAKADEYLKSQLGNRTELSIELVERKFWKRLGPTMPPSMYGADMEGTLFGEDDDCHGWNVSKLQSCLQLLLSDLPDNHQGGIPGVTTPYLYFGMWASVFCAHREDMNLLSINYLHAGAPKIWYAIAAGEDTQRLEQFCEGHYHQSKKDCPEYLRHKRCLLSPIILKKAGIPFTTTVQYPGDTMITFPGSYHFGFNTGFNVAEATNFAVPEWVSYGKLAHVCLCRPDSVRIDMHRFERLLLHYEKEVKQPKRLTWKDWALRQANNKKKAQEEKLSGSPKGKSRKGKEEDGDSPKSRRKAFWVEVMQPVTTKTAKSKKTKKTKSRKRSKNEDEDDGEVWHLAKPCGRKSLRQSVKVLCIMSAVVDGDRSDDSDQVEDEQCFSGLITEVRDDHARIHFDGMSKRDDAWMSIESPKLFLDGGRWGGALAEEELPPKHFWCEEDSKRRCA